MKLSVIILSYKSQKDLARLLPSVFSSRTDFEFEIIVVDNGSNDGTAEWLEERLKDLKYKDLKIIKNTNTGFAAGNNLGIKQAQGDYILLLNPDTKVEADTFQKTVLFLEARPNAGIVGCKVLKPDGSLDLACRRRFPNPWSALQRFLHLSRKNYNMLDTDENQVQKVDAVMGAFLMIKKSVIEKIGYLDETFFMYGEDLDWCWRVKEAGFDVWYYPEVFITHYKGSSSSKVAFRALKWFHDAMWIFYRKHYAKKYPAILNGLVFLGIYFRLFGLWFLNLLKSKPSVSR